MYICLHNSELFKSWICIWGYLHSGREANLLNWCHDRSGREDLLHCHDEFFPPNNQHGKDDHKLKLPQQRARRKVCCYRAYSVSFSKASDIIRKTAWWRWKTLHLLPVNWAQRQHFLVFEVYSLKRNAKEVKWEAENNIKDVNSAVLSKT